MEIVNPSIEKYITDLASPEHPILKKLNRDTHAHILMPRMLSGHVQGRILSMISKMIKPKNILEIGTFTGYSALCLAEGLTENGQLTTIDINEELEEMVLKYFDEAGIRDNINYILGNAIDIIPKLDGFFDLVFIDADKHNYQNYYDLVIDKVSSGGFILADNVLWSGKVVDEAKDKDTLNIHSFNEYVQKDQRVENVILPLRDGLLLVRKL